MISLDFLFKRIKIEIFRLTHIQNNSLSSLFALYSTVTNRQMLRNQDFTFYALHPSYCVMFCFHNDRSGRCKLIEKILKKNINGLK